MRCYLRHRPPVRRSTGWRAGHHLQHATPRHVTPNVAALPQHSSSKREDPPPRPRGRSEAYSSRRGPGAWPTAGWAPSGSSCSVARAVACAAGLSDSKPPTSVAEISRGIAWALEMAWSTQLVQNHLPPTRTRSSPVWNLWPQPSSRQWVWQSLLRSRFFRKEDAKGGCTYWSGQSRARQRHWRPRRRRASATSMTLKAHCGW